MLHPRRHRLTTFLLVAVYLAASTCSGLWHDHAAPPGSSLACCQHAEHACSEHADHDHGSSEIAGFSASPADSALLHDDDCTVCRFVGQRVMPVASGLLVTWIELSVELAVVRACQPVATTPRTTHSRAPPQVG